MKIAHDNVMVCIDCGYYLANGPMDEPAPGWSADQLHTRWEGYDIVNGDSDKDEVFSWSPCQGCGSTLGGNRMHCVALKA